MRLIHILSLLSLFCWAKEGDEAKYREDIMFVVEVSRHGARSSKKIFDFTVDKDKNFKNASQLTQLGRRQHFDLGAFIRKRYIVENRLLGASYDERDVYVQTTYLNRTYLSALYQLMGMYPENGPHKLDFETYDIGYEEYLT